MRKNFGSQPWMLPMPVLIVAAYDENGVPNAMNAGWGTISGYETVLLCLGSNHKTTQIIRKTGAFTVSLGEVKHQTACDSLGVVSGKDCPNKLEKAGFTTTKSQFVNAPIINELSVTLECEYIGETPDGKTLGKIVNVSADEGVLDGEVRIDADKIGVLTYDPVYRAYRKLGNLEGKAFDIGKALK